MSLKLNDEDGRIIDLLVDGSINNNSAPALTQVFSTPHPAEFEARLDAAERVLALLDNDPAPEPSADLAARTMSRIDQSINMPGEHISQPRVMPSQQRPHA